MIQFNPTQIANRIGRIALATVLSGLFIGILSQFGEFTWGESTTSPLTLVEWYVDAAFGIGIITVLLAFIVPVVAVVYWAVSSRFSWVRKWQLLVSGTIIAAAAWSAISADGIVPIITGTVVVAVYGLSILAAIALVETLFAGRPSEDITSGHVATGVGALVVAFLVLVPLLAVGSAAAGVVLPEDDDSTDEPEIDSSDGDELEDSVEPVEESGESAEDNDHEWGENTSVLEFLLDGRNATAPETYDDGEFSPTPDHVTSLEGESGTAVVSGVNESELPADRHVSEYPVAAYHTDAEGVHISDVEFEVDGDTVVPDGRYHIEIDGVDTSPDRQPGMVPHWAYNDTGESKYGAFVSSASGGLEDGYLLDMEQVESTFVYFDLVNDDGEIHRYVIEVERTDV